MKKQEPSARAEIPETFAPLPTNSNFIRHLGPIYRGLVDGRVTYGIIIDQRHTNRSQNCHGGMLATLADMILIATCREREAGSGSIPTVSLSMDFLAPVPSGAWVQGQADIVRATHSLFFARGELTIGKEPVLRFNGIFARKQKESGASSASTRRSQA